MFNPKWSLPFDFTVGSHIPVLIKVLSISSGDVLELGTGIYSTPLLHYLCSPYKRNLYSYDNSEKYVDIYKLRQFEDEYHKITIVDDWDKVLVDRFYSVVFIDQLPCDRRHVDAERFANSASYIILHDSGWKDDYRCHYKEIFHLFKYRYDYTKVKQWTTVLSNFNELKELETCL